MSIWKKVTENQRLMEIIRFVFTGGVSFLVEYGILYGLTEFVHLHYQISSAIGFTVSVIVNYLLCVVWVFQGARHQTRKAQILFLLSSLVGLGLNQLLMWLFVDVALIHYMIAKILATLIVMVWNYIAKKKVLVAQ